MVALIKSATLVGIDAVRIDVECVITAGQLPAFNIVGLPTTAVKEGAVRVRSALGSVGHEVPQKKVTVNLAPADLRKPGSALDLPTALSILIAGNASASGSSSREDGSSSGMLDAGLLDGLLVLGELALDGSVRPVPGVLAAALLARDKKLRGVLVPERSAAEALVVDDIEVYGVRHLSEVIDALAGIAELPVPAPARGRRNRRVFAVDMADVRGQVYARAAIELAVAGGHNLLMSGPPGTGKTMLARRIATVLPAMTHDEALETTKIYSALGLADGGLLGERPFRAPHHTISSAALLGGGTHPRPGEISLAHNGVLFLDEMPEFARATIEALRQPLEERLVTISRINGTIRLPSSFLLVAASNPCPCGWLQSGVRECTCSRSAVDRYRARMSGPLLDRIDLQVYVPPLDLATLRDPTPAEPSAAIRERVAVARERQRARLTPWNLRCNAEMTAKVLRESCPLDDACERYLQQLVEERRSMSARSVDRLIKVARTIADLLGQDAIDAECLHEAANFRAVDPTTDIFVAAPTRSAVRPLIARVRLANGESATVIVGPDDPDGVDVIPLSAPGSDEPDAPSSDEPAAGSATARSGEPAARSDELAAQGSDVPAAPSSDERAAPRPDERAAPRPDKLPAPTTCAHAAPHEQRSPTPDELAAASEHLPPLPTPP